MNNTNVFFKEFNTSITEMNRRKIAFRTFSISLFVSICISTLILIPISFQYYLISMLIFGLLLLVSELSFNRLFENSKKIKITISNQEIERYGLGNHEKFSIKSISTIRIKKTTKNLIREIRISRTDNSPLYLNGVHNFETFKDYLLLAVGKNANIHEIREPFDFDHPLFYFFFGTLLGALSIIVINFMLHMKLENFKIFQFSISCFIFIVVLYWFFSKPIAGRYGQNKAFLDYATIFTLILIGIKLIAF